jgi:putative peptidoglycan lipid II flippase
MRARSPAPSASLAHSAGLISVATMTSRVLGLVRDQVLAYLFGASDAMDAYNVAFRIPNLIRDLFAEGAMSAAFVPAFTRRLTRDGRDAAWRLGSNVLNTLTITTGVLVIAGFVFAHPIVSAFAADFANVPGKLELTVALTRTMLPFLTLVALAAAAMGMANSLHHFFFPALSPAMFNVGSIVCVLALAPVMPHFGLEPITAMAIGVLVGGAGQLLVQWPVLRKEGYRHRWVLDPRDAGLREVLLLMGPGAIGLAATQVNVFVNTVLATGQGTGAVSWLNFAFRLMYLPLGLFGVSLATAAMPTIALHAARDDMEAVRHQVANGLAMTLLLNVPATFGLIVLARPIVALLFERGAFTPDDTAATAAALVCYALGLTAYSAVKIVSPTFYALGRSRTAVTVSAGCVLFNAAVNVVLAQRMGYLGLALGTSMAAFLNAGILLQLLRGMLGGVEAPRLAGLFVRITLASIVMAAVAWGAESGLEQVFAGTGSIVRAGRVGVSIAAALLALLLAARTLGVAEFTEATRAIVRRLRGTVDPQG